MLDSFEMQRERIESDDTRQQLGLAPGEYGVVTLHRPANVDTYEALDLLTRELVSAAQSVRLIFPVHPRTRKMLEQHKLLERLENCAGITLIAPLGYIQFMNLVSGARLAITDSGGLQEETTYLDIPCLTLRPNTERPITISEGTNRLVKPADLATNVAKVLAGDWPGGQRPERWDGHTASRCVASLRRFLALD